MADSVHGFLLVDKPAGLSSYGVVHAVRGALGGRLRGRSRLRVGHTGTLDPAATGLLIVLCGSATRLGPFLTGLDKTYRGLIRFGARTDTLDADGEVVDRGPAPGSPAVVDAALDGFRGPIQQVPPVISALKVGGVAMHRLARGGGPTPEPKPRSVVIRSLAGKSGRWAEPGPAGAIAADDGLVYEYEVVLTCSSGTYVRSLARDLALAAGSTGHLAELRREAVGIFPVAEALPGDRIRDGAALRAALRPTAAALPEAARLILAADEAALVRDGHQPEAAWLDRLDKDPDAGPGAPQGLFLMLDPTGALVAVCRMETDSDAVAEPRLAAVFPAVAPEGSPRD